MNYPEGHFDALAKAARDFERQIVASWKTFNTLTGPQVIRLMLQPCDICGGKRLVWKSLDGPWEVGCTKCGSSISSEHPRLRKLKQHSMLA